MMILKGVDKIMNVLLVSLPQFIRENTFEIISLPPMAIYTLAAVLRQNKEINVELLEPCKFLEFDGEKYLKEKCLQLFDGIIGSSHFDIIGFSANTFNWGITKYIINHARFSEPRPRIVIGGLHASIYDDYVLRTTLADVVIRGEGEKTLRELCERIINDEDIDHISGITFKKDNQILRNKDTLVLTQKELEDSVIPAYDLIPKDNPYVQIPVESSRGCMFSCSFCSIPHRNNWRGLNENIVYKKVQESIHLCEGKIERRDILFVDDCFTICPERALNIIKYLTHTYGKNVSFFIEVRISNIITNKFINLLPDDTNIGMQIGVECGYDEGLKKIKKGINLTQLHEGLSILYSYGYSDKCFLSFIIGFPWETENYIFMTLDTIEYIARRYEIFCNINWLVLLPSDLWLEKEKYGININESVFDDILWMTNRELFFRTHPLVDINMVKRVEKRVQNMLKNNLRVRYNKPFAF